MLVLEHRKETLNMTDTAKIPAIIDVVKERQRQQTAEGYDAGHDDRYTDDELPRAALCYLAHVFDPVPDGAVPRLWPWPNEFWKPKARRSNLVRAAALIVAEIERLDRTEAKFDPEWLVETAQGVSQ